MNRSLTLVLCLLLNGPAFLSGQQATSKTVASLSGMVIKEPGSLPLRKVLIEFVAENQKSGTNYTATSDSDGRFSVDDIQPGRYRIYLEKTGYVTINARGNKTENEVVSISQGQQLSDLLFRMLPNAVITGRVTDEDGEPMSHVSIDVRRKTPGKPAMSEGRGVERTNDRGEYRFFGLFPGQYYVVAIPPPDARDYIHPPDSKPQLDNNAETRYLPTYYPGTHDGTQASIVVLRPGDEMPLNFTLIPTRTYHVRGIVTGFRPRQGLTVQLITKGGSINFSTTGAEVARDGHFEILGVAPGSYIATVATDSEGDMPAATAREEVHVEAGDVDGLNLALMPASTLTGRLRFDGPPPANIRQYPVPYAVVLHPDQAGEDSTAFPSRSLSAPVDRGGNFQWSNVSAGDYFVAVPGLDESGAYLKSVTLGDRNGDLGFSVAGPASLDVVMSFRGGSIEGAVLEPGPEQDQPVANATVVAVPERPYRKIPTRFKVASTDQNGHFTLRGLAPGTYTLFAWQDFEDNLYTDAEFLQSQEPNGTEVKIEEASKLAIVLKPSVIPADWQ